MNVFHEEIEPEGLIGRAVRHALVRLEGKTPLDLVEKTIETPFESKACPFVRDGFAGHQWGPSFLGDLHHVYKCANCGAKMTMRWVEG